MTKEEEKNEKAGEEVAEPAKAKAPAAKAKKKKLPARTTLKASLAELKKKKKEALESKDSAALKKVRSQYKKTNRLLRRVARTAAE